jgi:predicted nucleotidyltransferase
MIEPVLKAIAALNEMVGAGVIEQYAIAGATAVMFYAEPVMTHDLDVFALLSADAGPLISLQGVYAHARERGYEISAEHIVVGGVPIQILPAFDALTSEALERAREETVGSEKTRVVRLEHLLAIMAKTARPKDIARIAHIRDTAEVDLESLNDILVRHQLHTKWTAILERLKEQT